VPNVLLEYIIASFDGFGGPFRQIIAPSFVREKSVPRFPPKTLADGTGSIYLQVSNWFDNAVTIPDLPVKVLSANVLTGGEVTMTRADGKLSFKVDPKFRDPAMTVIKLTLEKPADGIPAKEVPGN